MSKIENYFIKEINQRKSCSKKLSKYVAVFDYVDQALIVLSATSGGVSTNQTKFRLDEISKIENYFIEEINKKNHAVCCCF